MTVVVVSPTGARARLLEVPYPDLVVMWKLAPKGARGIPMYWAANEDGAIETFPAAEPNFKVLVEEE